MAGTAPHPKNLFAALGDFPTSPQGGGDGRYSLSFGIVFVFVPGGV